MSELPRGGIVRRIIASLSWDTPAHIALANVAASAIALITAPIIARSIGAAGRGETAAALAAFALVPIVLAIGMPTELRRVWATARADSLVRSFRDVAATMVIPAVGIAFALSETLFRDLSTDSRIMVFIGVALAPLSVSWAGDVSVLVATGRYRAVMLVRLLGPTAFLVGVGVAAISGAATVATVLLANILGTGVTWLAGLLLVRVSPIGPRASHTRLLRRGVTYAGSSVAEAATYRLDQVIALPIIGAQQAGFYSVAVTIGSIPIALGQSLGAHYFRNVANAPQSQRPALTEEAMRVTISSSLALCVLLAIVSPVLIPVIFGAEFQAAVTPTLVYLLGSVFMVCIVVSTLLLAASGKGHVMTISQVSNLVVGLTLLVLLGPMLGAAGAALASTISYIVLAMVQTKLLGARLTSLTPTPRGVAAGIRTLVRRA